LAGINIDVTDMTDVWGTEDLSKHRSVIFKSTAELIGPEKGAEFGDEFVKRVRVVKKQQQNAFISFW